VSPLTALQLDTVFACVNIVSDGVSSLPLFVYERQVTEARVGKTKAFAHPLWHILHQEPNPEMTMASFLKTAMAYALLWGNFYGECERNNAGEVIAIWPRNSARTRPIRTLQPFMYRGDLLPVGTLFYETSDPLTDSSTPTVCENADTQSVGKRRIIASEDMVHVQGLSLDGRLGQDRVWLCREAIGLGLAMEKHSGKFFANGARPSGILTLPHKMEERAIEALRRSWTQAHAAENQWKLAVLEQGVQYTKVGANADEAGLIESRKLTREFIASIFCVPLHMLGTSEHQSKGNVEQASIEFVHYCLGPWLHRFEQEFNRKLFPRNGKTSNAFFAKFDTRKLLYPDAISRAQLYTSGRQNGFLSCNDVRELEDLNPIADERAGEGLWMPSNFQYADDPQHLGARDQADLDIEKANKIADHAAEVQNVGEAN